MAYWRRLTMFEFLTDGDALAVLETNYTEDRGIIRPKVLGYLPTDQESDAIDYLIGEWDYGFNASPKE